MFTEYRYRLSARMTISQLFLSGVLKPETEQDKITSKNILTSTLQMENSFVNIIDISVQTRNNNSPELCRTYYAKHSDKSFILIYSLEGKSTLEVGTNIPFYR